MSGWGILASGLAGGAQAVGNITAGYIDQERRLQSAQALSDIDEQKWARIDEARARGAKEHQKYMTVGEGADDALKFAERKAVFERDAKVADVRAMTPAEIEKADALRPGKIADAEAVADIATKKEIERAKALLPLEIQRAYAVADASGRASAAHREKPKTLLDKISEVEAAAKRPLTDEERLGVIGLIKATPTDKVTSKQTTESADGLIKSEVTTESQVPRGSRAGGGTKPSEAQAHAEAAAAIKQGKPAEAINARLAELGYKPLTAETTAELAGILPKIDPLPARTEYLRELDVLRQMRAKGPSPSRERDIAEQEAKVNRLLELAR